MKRKYKVAIICVLILFVAALTNPSKEQYTVYVKEKSVQKGENILEKGLYALIVSPVMNLTTTSKDYIFFTVYETDLGEGENFKVLGVFNKFFPLSNSEKAKDTNSEGAN